MATAAALAADAGLRRLRLGRGRLPADERLPARPRPRGPRRVPAGEPRAGAGPRRRRQRPLARQPGGRVAPRPAAPLLLAAGFPARALLPRAARDGGLRHARQDDHHDAAGLAARVRRALADVPRRRDRAEFRRRLPARHRPGLRDRGGRVRHGLLRQALEVPRVPAAQRRAGERRVRPRGHLRLDGGVHAGVPAAGEPRAGQRLSRRERRRRGGPRGRGALPRRGSSRSRRATPPPSTSRSPASTSGSTPCSRRRRRPRSASRRSEIAQGHGDLPRREAAARGGLLRRRRHALRRFRAPPDGDPARPGDAARQAPRRAHPGAVRAAFEHAAPRRLPAGARRRRSPRRTR